MTHSHRRHAISDEVWALLEVHLSGRGCAWCASQRFYYTRHHSGLPAG